MVGVLHGKESINMSEVSIRLDLERLPEGVWLATSDDVPGLVAQGQTVAETLEIAGDVVRKLTESYVEHNEPLPPALLHEAPQPVASQVPAGAC